MKDFDGVVWFRKTIDIPRNWARKNVGAVRILSCFPINLSNT